MDKLDEIVDSAVGEVEGSVNCPCNDCVSLRKIIRTAIARVLEGLVNQPRDGEVPVKEIYDLAKQLREGK